MTDETEVQAVEEVNDQPLSVRDEITKSLNEIKERESSEHAETPEKVTKPRHRNEVGKFAKQTEKTTENHVENEPQPQEQKKPVNVPQSWSATAKTKWAELPSDIQAEIAKREEEVHKGFTRMDEERNFGKQIKDVVTPYMPMITAEGGNPAAAIQDLLNTAYLLRTATPDRKAQLFAQLANQFGVDMNQLPQATYVDPHLQALEQRQRQLENELQRERALKAQQEQSVIHSEINAFANDPANIHFESVKAHMAALLQNGLAKDLRDAYDQAVYARPDIRSTLLEQQRFESQAKRASDIKNKTQAARNAAISVTGAPGVAVPNAAPSNKSLRDEISAAFRAAIN